VEYTVNPYIVRGLDYYSRTVFEFVSTEIGAQGTVCGGGRYDGLIEQLGGSPQPAIGFGAGIERLMLLMENSGTSFPEEEKPLIYIAGMDDNSRKKAFKIATELRLAGISCEIDHLGRSVKAQFKYADKLGVKYVATIGETEFLSGVVEIKNMTDGSREKVKFGDIKTYLISND
jgi:histidyl-tRNA synthetase